MFNPFSRPRGRLAVLAGVACAVALLPAAALAASPGRGAAATHGTPVLPKCEVANGVHPAPGAFVWSGNPGDGFAGGTGYELEVTNIGKHPCTLQGVPGLAAFGTNGKLVGSKKPASTTGPLVVLGPSQTAHINLTVYDAGNVCPRHSVPAGFYVYLPGQKLVSDTFLTGQACPGGPAGGVLSASAITVGVGIPLHTS